MMRILSRRPLHLSLQQTHHLASSQARARAVRVIVLFQVQDRDLRGHRRNRPAIVRHSLLLTDQPRRQLQVAGRFLLLRVVHFRRPVSQFLLLRARRMLLGVPLQVAAPAAQHRVVAQAASVGLAPVADLVDLVVPAVLVVPGAVPVVAQVLAVGQVASVDHLGDQSAVVVATKTSCNRSISSSPIVPLRFLKERSLSSVGCQLRSSLQS